MNVPFLADISLIVIASIFSLRLIVTMISRAQKGTTLSKALESGRPFKLPDSDEGWIEYDPEYHNGWFFLVDDEGNRTDSIGNSLDLWREELLADTWIIKK